MVSRKARSGIAARAFCFAGAHPVRRWRAGPLLPENGMLDGGTSHAPLRLIVRPHLERGGFHLDRFDACLDGELITTSRQPLLDGARALLARGFDPDAMLTIRLASSPADSFRPKPEWARWTITERERGGLQRTTWRPFADARGSHAVASPPGKNGLAEGEAAGTSRRRSRHGPRTRKGMIGELRSRDG
jgi:hypothetical protein